jgi:transposase
MRRYEISDEQWQVIFDLFQRPESSRGRPRRDVRELLNGAFWVLCSGAAWRDLPDRFGPWQTVYDHFRRWQEEGVLDQVLTRLHLRLDQQGYIDLDTWYADATMVRASRAAAGARKKNGHTQRPRAGTVEGRIFK